MVREDIIGALQSALVRGESMQQAMMTLFNAGYSKQEIESAAAMFHQQSIQQVQQPSQQIPSQHMQNTPQQIIQQTVKKDYFAIKSNIKLIIIIISLVILLGSLVGSILFKTELIEFFNSLLR